MKLSRKRRTLIAAFAVFSVLTVVYWLSTSGIDPRLVGQWSNGQGKVWYFEPDGTFTMAGQSPGARKRWSVSGNVITIWNVHSDPLKNLSRRIQHTLNQTFGWPRWRYGGAEIFTITQLEGDRLQIGHGLNMRRVPESAAP